jgi:hypothetical protein
VAAYLLNVRLAFHPENVSTVHGRNVVAGGLLYTHPSTAIRFEEIIGSRF